MKVPGIVLILLFGAVTLSAQEIPSTDTSRIPAPSIVPDSIPHPQPAGIPGRSAEIRFSRDTLLRMDYHDIGGIMQHVPGIARYDMGIPGQPSWLSYMGSLPATQALLLDGMPIDDPVTGTPRYTMAPFENAEAITIYPQHQAFWYGGNGTLLATNIASKQWDTPHPFTRLHHMFGPYEDLYTDVFFTLNPGTSDNLAFGLTRQTYGTNDNGRFQNSQTERWDVHGEYRNALSESFSFTIGDIYNDYYMRMNGGSFGLFSADSTQILFPDAYADTVFSTLDAELLNPTILIRENRNIVYGAADLRWFGKDVMRSTARVSYESGSRQYEDKGYMLASTEYFSYGSSTYDRVKTKRRWSRLRLDATHNVSIGWADLEVGGYIANLSLDNDSGYFSKSSSISSMLRGKLSFFAGPFRLTGFARLQNTYGQNTYGFGGTLETQVTENTLLWAGASVSSRPYSFIERYYINARTLGNALPDIDLENTILLEGGLRLATEIFETDIRGFVRRSGQNLYLSSQVFSDSLHSRLSPVYLVTDAVENTAGISMYGKASVWMLCAEVRGSWAMQSYEDAAFELPAFPEIQVSADIYLRANEVLVKSLDLKTGARFTYCSDYYPTVYLPEQGWFALPSEKSIGLQANEYTSYTRLDLFVYATIRRLATLHIHLYNALDTQYITTQFYPMPDMGLQFGVDWIFND